MTRRTLCSIVAAVGMALVSLAARAGAAEGVKVTIWESIPKSWDWKPPAGEPADVYDAPALAFSRLPVKYNGRGIEIDRAAPFALHGEVTIAPRAGRYRFLLRSRNASRLVVDGKTLASTAQIERNSSGHEHVPEIPPPEDPRWRVLAPGDQEATVEWTADGQSHQVELWALLGERKLRPETGELSVCLVAPGGVPIAIGSDNVELTDAGWTAFVDREEGRLDAFDAQRRRQAARSEDPYWEKRHALARQQIERHHSGIPEGQGNLIDRWLAQALAAEQIEPAPVSSDTAFFRRLALDTIGVIPSAAEVEAFLADNRPDKRARAIEVRLEDPRWADGWMGYWQDVLAENPGILKPTLNNTGPFRKYLHNALADNTPLDRLVTELIRMEGSALGGGPAGFGIASQNDAPMAAKTHVLAKAFLAADMRCARCHDAPFHPFEQRDLFGMAGLLAGKAQKIPATSTVPRQEGGRAPKVSVTLKAGEQVEPAWSLADLGPDTLPAGILQENASARERLAALITSATNPRFAKVLANRVWARYIGVALVDPVDDWDQDPTRRHPELLDALADELVLSGYDLKHLARLVFNSKVYQAQVLPRSAAEEKLIRSPARRRMSAEQVVDSLFASVGKPFRAEELNLDADGRRPPTEFLNLGVPKRAWQMTSMSNERDRPALALPVAQSIVDVLEIFGWRPSRQDPITVRDEATTPLQPAMLANGVVVATRIARLSDDSAITELCLQEQPIEALVRSVYLQILSRPPTEREKERLVNYLSPSYADRIVPGAKPVVSYAWAARSRVSWSNHLSPEATQIQIERERRAREGDRPTARLTPAFRERMEDVVWALVNSPEFVFVP